MANREAQFGAALGEIYEELDWTLLGRHYCHEGGENFFPEEQRSALLDSGLLFAGDVAEALSHLPTERGHSLYVGAALFELPIILCESIVLARDVTVHNLVDPETRELNRALGAVESRIECPLPRLDVPTATANGALYDHIWLASVLSDPTAFPALHDELYERRGTDLATGRGDLETERERAQVLVSELVDHTTRPALFSTSDEELPFVQAAARVAQRSLEIPDRGRLSGIVGDAIRICTLI